MAYNQPYGGAPPYGQPPPQGYPPQGQYGAPPPGQPPYGSPAPQYGQQPAYGQPPPQQYGSPAPQYGAPPGAPPQQYGQPPPQQYGAPQYGAPPPQPYGAPPPQNYGAPAPQYGQQPQYGAPPPQQYGAPQGQYPPAAQPYGAPPQQGYGGQQAPYVPQFMAPPGFAGPPTPPTLGYGAPQIIAWDASHDADALRKAMKGFGTDEKTLISVLANKDPLQIAAIKDAYKKRHKRNLEEDVKSEVSGYFEDALCAIIKGPLEHDVYLLNKAMDGPGTKEVVLNDVLLGRSNADLRAIKALYQQKYRTSLEAALKSDLSMKTERHFLMVAGANRAEDSVPVNPQQVESDVQEIYKATEGKMGTDELLVCDLLTHRNDAQIRAIAQAYEARYRRSLETVIIKEFSGHMESALLCQLRAGTDRIMRDATLLEDAMAGMGTKDQLLVARVVRFHWDKPRMQQIKAAYKHRFHKDLANTIRAETSGSYETVLLACL